MVHPDLPDQIVEAAASRRGRPHVYDRIDPARTALVVIDMQRAFLEPGAPSEVPAARAIVPAINRMATALRRSGGQVVWIQATFDAAGWPIFFEHMVAPELSDRIRAALQEGDPLHQLWPELAVEPEDWIVPKYRLSAFLPGTSVLPIRLRTSGIDTVLIAGTMTNVCCDTSARDAVMTDFKTVMLADANAARSDGAHLSALTTFLQAFGDVRNTAELIIEWSAAEEAAAE